MLWRVLGKYFLHGILFSLLLVVLAFVGLALMVMLIVVGFIIGLIIGLGILFLMIGFVNGVLGDYLWGIEAAKGIWSKLFHGLVLSIMLFIVNLLTFYGPILIFPGTATQVVCFIVSVPIHGAIGRAVALWFGREVRVSEEAGNTIAEFPKASFTQPPPKEISEILPICPLCKKRTQWEAFYRFGQGIKDYIVRCGTCKAEWESMTRRRAVAGVLSPPLPFSVSALQGILVLRDVGNNFQAKRLLNKEINLSSWRKMIGKFCGYCEAPLAEDEDACPQCQTRYEATL